MHGKYAHLAAQGLRPRAVRIRHADPPVEARCMENIRIWQPKGSGPGPVEYDMQTPPAEARCMENTRIWQPKGSGPGPVEYDMLIPLQRLDAWKIHASGSPRAPAQGP